MNFSDQTKFLSNISANIDDLASDIQDIADNDNVKPELPPLLLLLYVPIIVLAAIGPLLVITAILGTAALRNISNGLLLNLATSDLLFVILSCPTTLAQV